MHPIYCTLGGISIGFGGISVGVSGGMGSCLGTVIGGRSGITGFSGGDWGTSVVPGCCGISGDAVGFFITISLP